MPRRRAGRRAALGFALGLMVLGLGGCRWLPARRPASSLDPRDVSRAGNAGPGAKAPALPTVARTTAQSGVPLPPLPLRPVSDAEALALAPTPALDAALEEAEAMQSAVLTSLDEPAPTPPAPLILPAGPAPAPGPSTAESAPPVEGPRDESVQLAALPAASPPPDPAPAPVADPPAEPAPASAKADPEGSWREGLERLLGLAREQAKDDPSPGGLWLAREQILARLAESRGDDADDPERDLWQAVLDALAEAEAREADAPDEPPGEAPAESPAGPEGAPVDLAVPVEPALEILELRLCRKVDGFGLFEPAEPAEIRPGGTLTLYWEVEGLRAESDGNWFRTRLSSSAEILPADGGEPVWRKPLGTAEDACRRPRRDYFVNGRITLPDDLAPGSYLLRLSLDDLVSGRSASRTLTFDVRP